MTLEQESVHQSTIDVLARVGVPILKGAHAFYCLASTGYWLLTAVCCPLSIVYCLLYAVCCRLSTVYSLVVRVNNQTFKQERVHKSTIDILARVGVPILKGAHAFNCLVSFSGAHCLLSTRTIQLYN